MTNLEKTKQLNKLFVEWKKERNYKYFISDGIIDEEKFEKQEKKILFILKEVNAPGYEKDWDLRAHDYIKNGPQYQLCYNVARWSHGILNSFPPFNDVCYNREILKESLHSVAIMNLKKTPGEAEANMDKVKKVAKQDIDYIEREIEIINPNICICGGVGYILKDLFNVNKTYIPSPQIYYFKFNNMFFLDYWHPSVRWPAALTYYHLKVIFEELNEKSIF